MDAQDKRQAQKQQATKKWRANDEVRKAQNAKSAARNRARRARDREQAGKHPNRSSTNFEEGEDADGADEGGDLRLNIRRARLCVVNWTWGWGPENRWEKRFNDELQAARRISLSNMDAFFVRIGEHTAEGREILEQLKCAASFECDCTMGEVKDLFLQGYDMVVQVTSEVKFLESKVDQFAPAVSYSKLSDIHYYVEV